MDAIHKYTIMKKNDNEPRIVLGTYENGVLEIREGFKKLKNTSMEGYENVRKVIFPASLEELDEDVFSETEELEELDFSRVTKLKEIPYNFISCKTKIKEFIIPSGVTTVGRYFISEAEKGTKVTFPASVKTLNEINGNGNNDIEVYLFASGVNLDDVEADIDTLYVMPEDYPDYAAKLEECDSEAKLREIPKNMMGIYTDMAQQKNDSTPKQAIQQPEPVDIEAAPAPTPASAPQNTNHHATNTKKMANQLIPEELQTLIQQYLTDGLLTDKERQVILRKAEGMGLDRDEIDLYLDAEVQKIEQQTDAAVRRSKGKTCPFCGAPVPQLTDKCPECGGFITPEASEELQEIFDNLETALVDMKAGKEFDRSKATVERYSRKAKTYYGSNPKIQKLLEEVENEMSEAEKRSKRKAQQQTLSKIISNKWVWCVIEIVFVLLLFFYLDHKESEAYEIYQEAEGRGRVAEWNDVKSAKTNKILFTLGGVVLIGVTIGLMSREDSNEKE